MKFVIISFLILSLPFNLLSQHERNVDTNVIISHKLEGRRLIYRNYPNKFEVVSNVNSDKTGVLCSTGEVIKDSFGNYIVYPGVPYRCTISDYTIVGLDTIIKSETTYYVGDLPLPDFGLRLGNRPMLANKELEWLECNAQGGFAVGAKYSGHDMLLDCSFSVTSFDISIGRKTFKIDSYLTSEEVNKLILKKGTRKKIRFTNIKVERDGEPFCELQETYILKLIRMSKEDLKEYYIREQERILNEEVKL
jgi:hypothetical protein